MLTYPGALLSVFGLHLGKVQDDPLRAKMEEKSFPAKCVPPVWAIVAETRDES